MTITITIGDEILRVTMNDGPAARDFVRLLPLTLTLEDFASSEKIAYLPRKLTTSGEPAGYDPAGGDLAYYAPWGNIAVFYRNGTYSPGLVYLGHIDRGIARFSEREKITAVIEAEK